MSEYSETRSGNTHALPCSSQATQDPKTTVLVTQLFARNFHETSPVQGSEDNSRVSKNRGGMSCMVYTEKGYDRRQHRKCGAYPQRPAVCFAPLWTGPCAIRTAQERRDSVPVRQQPPGSTHLHLVPVLRWGACRAAVYDTQGTGARIAACEKGKHRAALTQTSSYTTDS